MYDKSLWRQGAFHGNDWIELDDTSPLPDHGDVLVSAKRFDEQCSDLLQRPFGGLGAKLHAGDAHEILRQCVSQLDLIVLDFPSFADGRAYSIARTIREKYRYKGELRAAGDVLIDQIPFMQRCGFDSFLVTHEPTRNALAAGRQPMTDRFYQPANSDEAPVPGRSWLRKSAAV